MTRVLELLSHQFSRWSILIVVGALGLSLTLWVGASITAKEQERVEHLFQESARARERLLSAGIRRPLEDLETLKRLFGSVERLDWDGFRKFAEPLAEQPGVLGFAWFPKVSAGDRASFEKAARPLWGPSYAIEERDALGERQPAGARDHYYPMLYSVPAAKGVLYAGHDLASSAPRARQIEAAIAGNVPQAAAIGSIPLGAGRDAALLILVPVYTGGRAPDSLAERQAAVSGVVVVAIDVPRLFAAANDRLADIGFDTALFAADPSTPGQLLSAWRTRLSAAAPDAPVVSASKLSFAGSIELASHRWPLRVDATSAWQEAHKGGQPSLVLPLGFALSGLLLVWLNVLLKRSALARRLADSREQDLVQWRATEVWANKLSMAVEQNPAAIYITGLDGRIEYVNETFVQTTGFSREEAIGQGTTLLRPTGVDEAIYRAVWESARAGRSWHGDIQAVRRDGTRYWERMLFAPIRDRDGQITNFMAIKENISELRQVMQRLQDSENRFLGAVSVMAEGFAILSPEGRFEFANRAAESFLDCAPGSLVGRRSAELPVVRLLEDGSICPPGELPSAVTLDSGREIRDRVIGFRYSDGSVRWMQVNTRSLVVAGAERWGVVMTMSDITERRQSEEQLKLAYEAIRCSGEGILVTDAEQHIISANPAFVAMTGYELDELIGETPALVASGRHDAHFFDAMHVALIDSGYWQGEIWSRRKSGDVFPEWLGVSVVRDEEGRAKYFVYIFSDLTERQETQRRIEFLAHHDPLTGLPNRLLLRDRMEHAQAKANRMQSKVAMIFLDLDRFKTINDSLGHPVGDALLKEVVERLKNCVRESDTISRQGGDEFIVLLDDVRDRESVGRVAEKIHLRMAEPIVLGGHSLTSSFSMGIALYPDDGEDFDTLLKKADTAMYHAKEAGRNAHRFFTEKMNQEVVEHLTLETQLRHALEREEFVLHYQPQLDLRTGSIIGVEALVRWNNPQHGLVSPGKFIPVAEDSGLIVPIGAWVIGEACRQARDWQDAGLPPFVLAVNLSAAQFKRADLVNTVINALVLSELDAQWLELELTESMLIQDTEVTLDALRRLKALGVKLSVDDFGTGYSSLTYLKRFAVDKLKIDQSFVRDLVSDPDDAAIVSAVVQMANGLKLKTIAEGVENEEQMIILQNFGCDEIQGYWYAPPMPAQDLEAFVRDRI